MAGLRGWKGRFAAFVLAAALSLFIAPACLAATAPDPDAAALAHLRTAASAGGDVLLVAPTIELGTVSPGVITVPVFVFDMGRGAQVTLKQLSIAGPDGTTLAVVRPGKALRPISDMAGTKAQVLARLADSRERPARRFLDRSSQIVLAVPAGDLQLRDGSTSTLVATAVVAVGAQETTVALPLAVTVAALPSETDWGAGDGHVHSNTWSVGSYTIAQRAAQAVSTGQKWLIMTDHWDWIQERPTDDLADWALYAADCATQQAAYGIPVLPGLEIAALLNKSHTLAYGLNTSVLPPADEAYAAATLVDRINAQNPGTSFAVAAHPYLSGMGYEDFTAAFRAIEIISNSATSNSSAVTKWFELLNNAVDKRIAGGSFPVGVGNSDAHTAYTGVNGLTWLRSPQGFGPTGVLEALKSGDVTASGRGDLGYFTLNGVEQGGVLPVYPTTSLKLSITQRPRTGRMCTRISVRNRNNAEIWYVANPTQTTYTASVPQPTNDTFRVVTMTFANTDGTDVSNVWCNPVFLDMNPAAVNHAPSALADAFSTARDTPLSVTAPGVLGNDTDPDGDALTAAIATGPAHGTVTLGLLGGFLYTPAAGYAGADSFTYTANDGKGGSATATVTIEVVATNRAPAAAADTYTAAQDTPLSMAAPGVLANDSDPDGDTLTAAIVTSPAHGVVSLGALGDFVYTPAAGYAGPDSFIYTANDGRGGSATATVSIQVTGTVTNHGPTAGDDTYTTAQDAPLSVAAPGVLANDSDPNGDVLSAALVAAASHGSVTLALDGGFVFTPAADYSGPDSFTYSVSDGRGGSATATVSIDVRVTWTRFDQTDARINWTGRWSTSKNPAHYGGSARYSKTAGSKVTIAFTGTDVRLIGAKVPSGGSARISIDGGAPQIVSFTSGSRLYQQMVFSRTGLADGAHTIVIEVVGSGDVYLDAVDVTGTL